MKNNVTITRIFWKRTYLFVEYTADSYAELSMVKLTRYNYEGTSDVEDYIIKSEHVLETKVLDEKNKLYRGKINIAIAEGRKLLDSGKWKFIVDGDPFNRPNVTDEVLFNIENAARVFRYGANFYAFVVTFSIDKVKFQEDGEEYIGISLFCNYMKKNKRPFKRTIGDALYETKKIKKRVRKIGFILAKRAFNMYYHILRLYKFNTKRHILFMSENRVSIMDNLEAIDTRLKERNLDKEYKIYYSFRNIFDGNRQRIFSWLKVINKIAKCDYIFVDDYVPIFAYINLSKKTTLVQTWHAGFGFKLVGYGRFGIKGSPRPTEACHRKYTYGLIGNDNLKEIYSEVWGIEKEALLPTGMPRLEHFLDKAKMKEIRDNLYVDYPTLKGKKVITFAPTYRGSSQLNAYYDYDKIDFMELYKFCKKNNYAVCFGKHHFIKQEIPIPEECRDLIFDMAHIKLNDLFYVTDILITDYSSAFYDFLLLNKPVLFFVYDKAYFSATRGVHRPIDDVAPGKVCESFDELMNALKNEDYGDKKKAEFLTDNCVTNKKIASDQVIDFVILKKGTFEECRK